MSHQRFRSTNWTSRGFTLVELLVALGIVIILLSIFIPYLLSIRESNNRGRCADKLRQIRDALQVYAADNERNFPRVRYDEGTNPNGYVAYSGPDDPDPFAPESFVQPNDVTASLWLLVRGQIVKDPVVFICPSSDGWRDRLIDSAGKTVDATRRGNFRNPSNLTYSYASPFSSAPGYRLNSDWLRKDFALMADRNPGKAGADADNPLRPHAPPLEKSRANSINHNQSGQNVLFADGSVRFEPTPYCGVGSAEGGIGDNIYTARAAVPTTQPSTLPIHMVGFVGSDIGPATPDDSYLVPTRYDMPPPPRDRIAALGTTHPTTTATSTTVGNSTPSK